MLTPEELALIEQGLSVEGADASLEELQAFLEASASGGGEFESSELKTGRASQEDAGGHASAGPIHLAQAETGAATATEAGSGAAAGSGTAAAAGAAAATPLAIGPIVAVLGGVAAVAGAAGGGGGGGSSAAFIPVVTTTSGIVIDGPVKGATIFYDTNNNKVLDSGEPSTTTRADGTYDLNITGLTGGKLVVLPGGIDTFSGQKVGYLGAEIGPNGVTTVTPITYLLATTNLTQEEVKAALGLTGITADLRNFDPYAAMKSGDPVQAALGQKLYTISQQIYTAISTAAQVQVSSNPSSSNTVAITNVMEGVANAIRTASVLPTAQGTGDGLMNTITTFAVAAASGVNTNALVGNANALTSIGTSLADNPTAQGVINAVNSVNAAISENYAGLTAALVTGGDALTRAQAIAAISQTSLLQSVASAITTGNTGTMDALATGSALDSIIQTVSTQIASGTLSSDGTVAIDLPQVLTKTIPEHTDALAAVGSHVGLYAPQHIVTLKVADAEWDNVVDGLTQIRESNIDILSAADGTLTITDAQAQSVIQEGLVFAENDAITLQAEGTQLNTSLKALQTLGVDAVSIAAGAVLNVSLGAGTLDPTNIPQFTAGATVKLNIADAQISEVAEHAAALKAAGIDSVKAADGTLDLNFAQVDKIVSEGLGFAPDSLVTAQVSDAELLQLLQTPAFLSAGLDQIDMTDNTATITDAQASALVDAGINFVAADDVTLQADGTQLTPSLKELQTLGVDGVSLAAGATLGIHLGAGELDPDNIPQFTDAAHVTLKFTDGATLAENQVAEVADAAQALANAGIDQISAVDGDMSLNPDWAQAIIDAGLTFRAEDTVEVVVSDEGLSPFITQMGSYLDSGIAPAIDFINMDDNTGTITEAQASTLVEAGLGFVAQDDITMQADGTELSTSLKDLQDIGVDRVATDTTAAAGPGRDVVLDLGLDLSGSSDPASDLLAFLESFSGPLFENGSTEVQLNLPDEGLYNTIANSTLSDDIVTALVDLGVDYVKVLGTNIDDDLNNP